MTDRELITQIKQTNDPELLKKLWLRYENLVHKNWAILRRQLNNTGGILSQEGDFYSESYIAFTKTIKAINLEKIKDDKWLFLGYFRLYLKNVRSDFISRILKQYSKEKSFYVDTEEGETPRIDISPYVLSTEAVKFDPVEHTHNVMAELKCDLAVSECMKNWDEKRRKIYQMRSKGILKTDIAKSLGVHPGTITWYLDTMRKDLEKRLFC